MMTGVAIWDAFLFNDELELLDVRLRQVAGVVDHVVVVEGDRTFTGLPKPLHFADAGIDTSWFPGTVESVVVELPEATSKAWDRENAQRAGLGAYLRERADPADLLLIGDVDELPRRDVLKRLARTLREPARLRMVDALYYANWHQPQPWTLGPIVTRLDGLDHPSVRGTLGVRLHEDDRFVEEYVPDAGWHLPFLGGPDAIVAKLGAYSHQELNTQGNRREAFLRACVRYGVHFAGWTVLRRRSAAELEPELRELAATHPELFDLVTRPSPLRGRAWCAWAWLRGRLPDAVVAWADDHPGPFLLVAGAPLVLVQVLRDLRRRSQPLPRWPPGKEFRPSSA
jgi:beta-1,4-mannosyl-glycoprotein beta-1,4-N-acetylglucosaminyltransferase